MIPTRDSYDQKVEEHINTSPSILLKDDPTKRQQRCIQEAVKKMFREGKITKETTNYLIQPISFSPRMYGAPEIHREGVPIRPVVDFRNSAPTDLRNIEPLFYKH